MKEKPVIENPPAEVDMEREIWAAEMGDAPSIDLHGMDKSLALSELESFLHQEIMDGERVIKIVHGRGTGALRKEIHRWLSKQKNNGLVLYYRDSRAPGQTGGATLALLEQIKD